MIGNPSLFLPTDIIHVCMYLRSEEHRGPLGVWVSSYKLIALGAISLIALKGRLVVIATRSKALLPSRCQVIWSFYKLMLFYLSTQRFYGKLKKASPMFVCTYICVSNVGIYQWDHTKGPPSSNYTVKMVHVIQQDFYLPKVLYIVPYLGLQQSGVSDSCQFYHCP